MNTHPRRSLKIAQRERGAGKAGVCLGSGVGWGKEFWKKMKKKLKKQNIIIICAEVN